MGLKRSVRIIKKVQQDGRWKFMALERSGSRYVWDMRPGRYFLDWWEGARRKREYAGKTPSQALAAQRKKQNELAGALVLRDQPQTRAPNGAGANGPAHDQQPEPKMSVLEAKRLFLAHVRTHSPDKPETVRRYEQVMGHFERVLGHRRYIEDVSRADIDEYKTARCQEKSERHDRLISARTVNFEVSTLRSFSYYLIKERGVKITNPCTRFKHLREAKKKAKRRPPTYSHKDLDELFQHMDLLERALFATLLLTGLRKRELSFLTWRDLDLKTATLRVSGDGKEPADRARR